MDFIQNPQATKPVTIHILKLTLQFLNMYMVTGTLQNSINGPIDPALLLFVGISVILGRILVQDYSIHFSGHPMTRRSPWRLMTSPNRPV